MAQYALIQEDQITNLFDSIPSSFDNSISGFDKLNDEEREQFGFFKVEQPDLSGYNPQLHDIVSAQHKLVDGRPVYDVVYQSKYSEEELDAKSRNDFWSLVRVHRDHRLNKSDWALMADVVERKGESWKNEWARYRQFLRDITNNQSLFDELNGQFTESIFPSEPNL